MTLFFRTFIAIVGAAFLFAVANLFVSGIPGTQDNTIEIAALAPEASPFATPGTSPAPGPAPGTAVAPGPADVGTMLMQILTAVVAPEQSTLATPATAPTGAITGLGTAPTNAPPSAGGPQPDAARTVVAGGDYDAMAETWRTWMQSNGIETGAMAVILPDGTEYGTGLGRTADDVRPIMSLSKAITGLCVDQLLLEAGLGWDTTLGDIAPQMSEAGLTPRAWNQHITLASLVTHSSGLAPDLTQSNMAQDTHGALGLHRRWAAAALQEEAMTGTPGTYFYNNTNYAVLGVVAEALSGQSYAQACMDRIVTPAGITDAVIEGRYGSLSSYGGWEMSAMDHARLIQHWFAPDQPHMASDRPDVDGYALGYFNDGAVISHSGRFCQRDHPTGGVGSVFLHGRDGTVFSANWDACIDPALRDALISQIREQL